MARITTLFGALMLAQAAHSVEEYAGRLYESFPPARWVSGLASPDLERGFVILNIALVTIGVLCFLGPVRGNGPSADAVAWIWVVVEAINGVGHPLWSLRQGGYTPGVITAPILLVLALLTAGELLHRSRRGHVTT